MESDGARTEGLAGGGVLPGERGEGDVLVGAGGDVHTPMAVDHLALGRRVDGGEVVGEAAAVEAEGLRNALRGGGDIPIGGWGKSVEYTGLLVTTTWALHFTPCS